MIEKPFGHLINNSTGHGYQAIYCFEFPFEQMLPDTVVPIFRGARSLLNNLQAANATPLTIVVYHP